MILHFYLFIQSVIICDTLLCARNYSFKDDYEAAIPKKPSQSYVAHKKRTLGGEEEEEKCCNKGCTETEIAD